jgi:hypothetical protein
MNVSDIAQWFVILSAIGGFWLAFRKNGSERLSLYGIGSNNLAQANEIQGQTIFKLTKEVQELKMVNSGFISRLEVLERKKYRITIEFEIGDPPQMGAVNIEPIIDEPVTRPMMKKSKPK